MSAPQQQTAPERKERLKLTNKDVRDAFEYTCEYFDNKYGVYYDDGPESLRDFHLWVNEYIVTPTNQIVKSKGG